jgi:hypothetical protein
VTAAKGLTADQLTEYRKLLVLAVHRDLDAARLARQRGGVQVAQLYEQGADTGKHALWLIDLILDPGGAGMGDASVEAAYERALAATGEPRREQQAVT